MIFTFGARVALKLRGLPRERSRARALALELAAAQERLRSTVSHDFNTPAFDFPPRLRIFAEVVARSSAGAQGHAAKLARYTAVTLCRRASGSHAGSQNLASDYAGRSRRGTRRIRAKPAKNHRTPGAPRGWATLPRHLPREPRRRRAQSARVEVSLPGDARRWGPMSDLANVPCSRRRCSNPSRNAAKSWWPARPSRSRFRWSTPTRHRRWIRGGAIHGPGESATHEQARHSFRSSKSRARGLPVRGSRAPGSGSRLFKPPRPRRSGGRVGGLICFFFLRGSLLGAGRPLSRKVRVACARAPRPADGDVTVGAMVSWAASRGSPTEWPGAR